MTELTAGNVDKAADFFLVLDATDSTPKKVKATAIPGTLLKGTAAEITTLSTNESATSTHGLGAAPDFISLKLVCTDAGGDVGYSQNDEVHLSGLNAIATGTTIVGVFANATDLTIRMANNQLPPITNKSNNTAVQITDAKWKLVATPYRIVA